MTVYELSREQINELKNKLFWGCYEISNLDIDELNTLNATETEEEIPDNIVYSAFSGYCFVNDDFFCTAGQ